MLLVVHASKQCVAADTLYSFLCSASHHGFAVLLETSYIHVYVPLLIILITITPEKLIIISLAKNGWVKIAIRRDGILSMSALLWENFLFRVNLWLPTRQGNPSGKEEFNTNMNLELYSRWSAIANLQADSFWPYPWRPWSTHLIPSIILKSVMVSLGLFFKQIVCCHICAWQPFWSCDQNNLYKFWLTYHTESSYENLIQLA